MLSSSANAQPVTTTLPRDQAPAAAAAETLRPTRDEAVRMALENNPELAVVRLRAGRQRRPRGRGPGGVPADLHQRDQPQQCRHAAGEPVLRRGRHPDRLLVCGRRSSSSGCKWGGASYNVSFLSQRTTTDNPFTSFTPSLTSALQAIFSQPLLRDFKTDSARAQIEIEHRNRDIADIQVRERSAQVGRQRGSAPTGRWSRPSHRSTSSSGRSTSPRSSSATTARGSTSASRRRSTWSLHAPRSRSVRRT